MVFAVQCPEPKCRKYMLVEEEDRGRVVPLSDLQDVHSGRRQPVKNSVAEGERRGVSPTWTG